MATLISSLASRLPAAPRATARPATLSSVLLPLLRPWRWWLAAALLLNAVHGAAVAFQTLVPKWLVDDVIAAPDLDPATRWRRFAALAGLYLAASLLLRMAAWHLGYRLFTRVREAVALALRARFFAHVNHLCLRFHLQRSTGDLFACLFGSPLANVLGFYQQASMFLAGAVITVGVTLAATLSWDVPLAITLIVTVAVQIAMMRRSQRRIHEIQREYQRIEGEVGGTVNDLLRGNRAVKLHAMEQRVVADFTAQAAEIGRMSWKRDIGGHLQWMQQEASGYVAFTALMAVCLWRHLSGDITLGMVTAAVVAFAALQGPMQSIFTAFTQWGGARAGIERIGEVLTADSTTPDPPRPAAVPERGDLLMAGVDFAYEAGRPVLAGLDLRIPYGQRVALVGPSGSGKSTIAQLLLRLYDPDRGTVALDGTDLRSLAGSDLRRRWGVVPQDPFIFRTTIRDNVRAARPEADDAAIRTALERAQAWEFVAAMPDGLDARVGEGGASLSGGQRQRLAIARALIADPAFLLFDEATSALDTLSEELIQRTLDGLGAGRTTIIIAHRLATVQRCDRILVVANGRIIQDGTYDGLAATPGLFADLVRGQHLRH